MEKIWWSSLVHTINHASQGNRAILTAEVLSWLGFKRHRQLHECKITIHLQFPVLSLVQSGDRDSANLRGHVYVRFVLMGLASRIHTDFEVSWVNISWLASRPRKPRKFYPTENTRYTVDINQCVNFTLILVFLCIVHT